MRKYNKAAVIWVCHSQPSVSSDTALSEPLKQISIPIDILMGIEICLIKTFFQISFFVYSRTNKYIEVWIGTTFHFWVNHPFNITEYWAFDMAETGNL